MSCISQLAACYFRPEFSRRPVSVGFVVDKVAPKQMCLQVPQFPYYYCSTSAPYSFMYLQCNIISAFDRKNLQTDITWGVTLVF